MTACSAPSLTPGVASVSVPVCPDTTRRIDNVVRNYRHLAASGDIANGLVYC